MSKIEELRERNEISKIDMCKYCACQKTLILKYEKNFVKILAY